VRRWRPRGASQSGGESGCPIGLPVIRSGNC
jgi:hypothetical protein